jgi:large subunit ribosomal protein L13
MKISDPILLDAKEYTFGRLVSTTAKFLRSKHSADFSLNTVIPQTVQIKDLQHVSFTGKKIEQKKIYRHTQYPGRLLEIKFQHQFQSNPEKTFLNSLKHMLPKNSLRKKYLRNVVFI